MDIQINNTDQINLEELEVKEEENDYENIKSNIHTISAEAKSGNLPSMEEFKYPIPDVKVEEMDIQIHDTDQINLENIEVNEMVPTKKNIFFLKTKYEAIQKIFSGVKRCEVIRQYVIDYGTLEKWISDSFKIIARVQAGKGNGVRVGPSASPFPKTDAAMMIWFIRERNYGNTIIDRKIFCEKAVKFSQRFGEANLNGSDGFWFRAIWKKRHNMILRTIGIEGKSVKPTCVKEFKYSIPDLNECQLCFKKYELASALRVHLREIHKIVVKQCNNTQLLLPPQRLGIQEPVQFTQGPSTQPILQCLPVSNTNETQQISEGTNVKPALEVSDKESMSQGEKVYQPKLYDISTNECLLCSKRYLFAITLRVHLREMHKIVLKQSKKVTKSKQFCPFCSKKYELDCYLTAHLKKVHKISSNMSMQILSKPPGNGTEKSIDNSAANTASQLPQGQLLLPQGINTQPILQHPQEQLCLFQGTNSIPTMQIPQGQLLLQGHSFSQEINVQPISQGHFIPKGINTQTILQVPQGQVLSKGINR